MPNLFERAQKRRLRAFVIASASQAVLLPSSRCVGRSCRSSTLWRKSSIGSCEHSLHWTTRTSCRSSSTSRSSRIPGNGQSLVTALHVRCCSCLSTFFLQLRRTQVWCLCGRMSRAGGQSGPDLLCSELVLFRRLCVCVCMRACLCVRPADRMCMLMCLLAHGCVRSARRCVSSEGAREVLYRHGVVHRPGLVHIHRGQHGYLRGHLMSFVLVHPWSPSRGVRSDKRLWALLDGRNGG